MARYPKGASPKLTEELIEQIAAAIRGGCYVETASALCGVSKDTFYRWLKEALGEDASPLHVKLSDAVKKGLAEAEARDVAVIDSAAQSGQWQAAAWRLERKFPEKWGRQARLQVEHSGPEGGPIEVKDSRESMKRILTDPDAFAALEVLEATFEVTKPKP